MSLCWVIYDISDNGIRNKVSSKCKNYGLVRVQKSAFLGELTTNRSEMLSIEINDIVGKNDAVFILPSCESCFTSRIITGNFDEDTIRKKNWVIISGINGKENVDS